MVEANRVTWHINSAKVPAQISLPCDPDHRPVHLLYRISLVGDSAAKFFFFGGGGGKIKNLSFLSHGESKYCTDLDQIWHVIVLLLREGYGEVKSDLRHHLCQDIDINRLN